MKIKTFLSLKCILEHHLQNVRHIMQVIISCIMQPLPHKVSLICVTKDVSGTAFKLPI